MAAPAPTTDTTTASAPNTGQRLRARFAAIADSDLLYEFRRSKLVMAAAAVSLLMLAAALLAPWISPYNPYDPASINLIDAHNPPAWVQGGDRRFLLGTDDQGRDILSTILYGTRSSILIALSSVLLALSIGVTTGLAAGYFGGRTDSIIMRIADVQLTFPAILTALMIDGVAHALLGSLKSGGGEFWVLVVAIGFSFWVQFARVVRGSTLVEKNKEYVQAARVIGLSSFTILRRHILPNVMGPVLVIGTIALALAIITEATLSFLGVGLPATQPSLGTMIRIGNNFLLSGEWWITIFPGVTLAVLVLAVNLVGDWLRDALNPKLR